MTYPSLHQNGFHALAQTAGHNTAYDIYQLGFERTSPPATFAVYIPPGAVRVEMYLYLPTSSPADPIRASCAVRFGQEPGLVNLTAANWGIYPFDSSEYGGLLDGRTYVPKPVGDHCTVINRNYSRNPLKASGWLNVRVLSIKGTPFKFGYAVDVRSDLWEAWINTVVWDASGNPTDGVTPTPIPDPEPTPEPVPTPAGKVTVNVNGHVIVTSLPLKIEVK